MGFRPPKVPLTELSLTLTPLPPDPSLELSEPEETLEPSALDSDSATSNTKPPSCSWVSPLSDLAPFPWSSSSRDTPDLSADRMPPRKKPRLLPFLSRMPRARPRSTKSKQLLALRIVQ